MQQPSPFSQALEDEGLLPAPAEPNAPPSGAATANDSSPFVSALAEEEEEEGEPQDAIPTHEEILEHANQIWQTTGDLATLDAYLSQYGSRRVGDEEDWTRWGDGPRPDASYVDGVWVTRGGEDIFIDNEEGLTDYERELMEQQLREGGDVRDVRGQEIDVEASSVEAMRNAARDNPEQFASGSQPGAFALGFNTFVPVLDEMASGGNALAATLTGEDPIAAYESTMRAIEMQDIADARSPNNVMARRVGQGAGLVAGFATPTGRVGRWMNTGRWTDEAAAAAQAAGRTGSMGGRMARSAAVGAPTGAAATYLANPVDDRFNGIEFGAGGGAALGFALPPVFQGISSVGRRIDQAAGITDRTRAAMDRILRRDVTRGQRSEEQAMRVLSDRLGITPTEARELAATYREAGLEPLLNDVVGEQGRGVIGAVARRPTEGRDIAQQAYEEAALNLPTRIDEGFERAIDDDITRTTSGFNEGVEEATAARRAERQARTDEVAAAEQTSRDTDVSPDSYRNTPFLTSEDGTGLNMGSLQHTGADRHGTVQFQYATPQGQPMRGRAMLFADELPSGNTGDVLVLGVDDFDNIDAMALRNSPEEGDYLRTLAGQAARAYPTAREIMVTRNFQGDDQAVDNLIDSHVRLLGESGDYLFQPLNGSLRRQFNDLEVRSPPEPLPSRVRRSDEENIRREARQNPRTIEQNLDRERSDIMDRGMEGIRDRSIALNDDMVDVLTTPEGLRAIREAQKTMTPEQRRSLAGLPPLLRELSSAPPNMRRQILAQTSLTLNDVDSVAIALNTAGSRAQERGDGRTARILFQFGRAMRGGARGQVPEYDDLLQQYARVSQSMDAIETGSTGFRQRGNTDQFREDMADVSVDLRTNRRDPVGSTEILGDMGGTTRIAYRNPNMEDEIVADLSISQDGRVGHIDIMDKVGGFGSADANRAGAEIISDMAESIRRQYPDLEVVHGYRVTGARERARQSVESGEASSYDALSNIGRHEPEELIRRYENELREVYANETNGAPEDFANWLEYLQARPGELSTILIRNVGKYPGHMVTRAGDVERRFQEYGPSDRTYAQVGARRSVQEEVGENPAAAPRVAREMAYSQEQRARNREIFGEEGAAALEEFLALNERQLRNLRSTAPNTGSATALRSQDDEVISNVAEGMSSASYGNFGHAAARFLRALGIRDQDAEQIVRMSVDPKMTDRAIDLIERATGDRLRAREAVQNISVKFAALTGIGSAESR